MRELKMAENSRESEGNEVQIFGITIPKTISIGLVIMVLLQGGYFVWTASKYASSMDRLSEKLQQTHIELNKIKTDLYTRGEANLQFESFRRELDLQNKINDRQDADLKDLRGGR